MALNDESQTQRFVTNVTRQSIFAQVPLPNGHTDVDPSRVFETISCRSNTDVFVASKNCVRVTRINDVSTNYRLLNVGASFMIRSLVVNSLGTLLAVVGDTEIKVASIPLLAQSGTLHFPIFAYPARTFPFQVIKVLWHPAAANDRSLVVLTRDSTLFCYDALSFGDSALSSMKLSLLGVSPTSISFGNPETLMGSLTLYVSLSEAQVYALYPFFHQGFQIATTEEAVDEALDEARAVIEAIEAEFHYEGIVSSMNSPLQSRLIIHYEFYLELKSYIRYNLEKAKEVRVNESGVARELWIVKPKSLDFPPALQGPVFTSTSTKEIFDISCFSPNKFASFLVTAGAGEEQVIAIDYLVQASPLLMQFKNKAMPMLKDTSSEAAALPKAHGYKMPRKGFGFVDREIECRSLVGLKAHTKDGIQRQAHERDFCAANFEVLSLLKRDSVISSTPQAKLSNLHVFGANRDKISFVLNNTVLMLDACDMVDATLRSLVSGTNVSELPCPRVSIPLICDDIASLVYMHDDVGSTGDYLLCSKTGGAVEVIRIAIANEDTKEEDDEDVDTPDDDNDVDEDDAEHEWLRTLEELVRAGDANGGEHSEEMEAQLRYLKTLQITAAELRVIQGEPYDGSLKHLSALNALSTVTLKHVAAFAVFTIKLQVKLTTQLVVFQSEIHALSKVANTCISQEKINSYQERISTLKERQGAVNQKSVALKEKLYTYLSRLNTEKPLPLSLAEKNWFRELNSISEHLQGGPSKQKSLSSAIEALQCQAKMYIETIKNKNKGEKDQQKSAPELLKEIEMRNHFIKFAAKLQEEEKLIRVVKHKLGDCFEALKITP